jgi:hypothetical protein
MCFESTEYAKSKLAKTDIECWKVLKKGKKSFRSPFRTFSYKIGVVTPLVKLHKETWEYCIYQGYHSYRSEKRAIESYHYDSSSHKICKFIIPAGSRYYANVEGEYVSERIMLLDEQKNSQ